MGQRPAVISAGEISQVQEDESFAVLITINRYTGAIKFSSVDKKNQRALPDMNGTCVRAQRKF